jgi:hypothetical protein
MTDFSNAGVTVTKSVFCCVGYRGDHAPLTFWS